jgi:hypothetical protein
MQFHVEITAEKIGLWMAEPGASFPRMLRRWPDSVQSLDVMAAASEVHLANSHALANQIYGAWLSVAGAHGASENSIKAGLQTCF